MNKNLFIAVVRGPEPDLQELLRTQWHLPDPERDAAAQVLLRRKLGRGQVRDPDAVPRLLPERRLLLDQRQHALLRLSARVRGPQMRESQIVQGRPTACGQPGLRRQLFDHRHGRPHCDYSDSY